MILITNLVEFDVSGVNLIFHRPFRHQFANINNHTGYLLRKESRSVLTISWTQEAALQKFSVSRLRNRQKKLERLMETNIRKERKRSRRMSFRDTRNQNDLRYLERSETLDREKVTLLTTWVERKLLFSILNDTSTNWNIKSAPDDSTDIQSRSLLRGNTDTSTNWNSLLHWLTIITTWSWDLPNSFESRESSSWSSLPLSRLEICVLITQIVKNFSEINTFATTKCFTFLLRLSEQMETRERQFVLPSRICDHWHWSDSPSKIEICQRRKSLNVDRAVFSWSSRVCFLCFTVYVDQTDSLLLSIRRDVAQCQQREVCPEKCLDPRNMDDWMTHYLV